MVNAIFFPAISTLSLSSTSELWRIATKTSNTYNNYLTMDMLFRYLDNPSELDFSGKYMTLFHMGTDSSSNGFSVCLYKDSVSGNISIGIRFRAGSGTNWADLENSFVDLTTIGDVDSDGFYIMFQYNYSGSNKIINFYVVQFNGDTNKTSPDFSFETTTGPSVGTTSLNQWGFGSLPQSLVLSDSPDGYNDTNGYNGYVAQNLQLTFLRTWNPSTLIPSTSTTDLEYAMFNTNSSYSLYNLNKNYTAVPSETSNLNFQLEIPPDNTNLSGLSNNAVNPSVSVTTTTSTTAFQTLDAFAINSTLSYNVVETSEIPCVLKGSKVLTLNGYVPIENIKIGDIILSHDNRELIVEDILCEYTLSKNVKCVKIKKGIYSDIHVTEDTCLSFHHGILIENEFIPAEQNTIFDMETVSGQTLYQFYCLQTPNYLTDTMIVNGIPTEVWGGWKPYDKTTHDLYPMKEREFNKNGNRVLQKIS